MTKNRSFLAENGATPILANPSHLAYSWRILMFLIVISTLFTTRNFTVVIDYVNTIDFLGTLLQTWGLEKSKVEPVEIESQE